MGSNDERVKRATRGMRFPVQPCRSQVSANIPDRQTPYQRVSTKTLENHTIRGSSDKGIPSIPIQLPKQESRHRHLKNNFCTLHCRVSEIKTYKRAQNRAAGVTHGAILSKIEDAVHQTHVHPRLQNSQPGIPTARDDPRCEPFLKRKNTPWTRRDTTLGHKYSHTMSTDTIPI